MCFILVGRGQPKKKKKILNIVNQIIKTKKDWKSLLCKDKLEGRF